MSTDKALDARIEEAERLSRCRPVAPRLAGSRAVTWRKKCEESVKATIAKTHRGARQRILTTCNLALQSTESNHEQALPARDLRADHPSGAKLAMSEFRSARREHPTSRRTEASNRDQETRGKPGFDRRRAAPVVEAPPTQRTIAPRVLVNHGKPQTMCGGIRRGWAWVLDRSTMLNSAIRPRRPPREEGGPRGE